MQKLPRPPRQLLALRQGSPISPTSRLFFGNVTRIGPQAWDFVQTECKNYAVVGLAEVHVGSSEIDEWQHRARGLHRRLYANPARPTDKAAPTPWGLRANEGGEWLLVRSHLHSHSIDFALDSADRQVPLDGISACILNFRGFQVALICFYGFPTIGMTGRNLQRFSALGALLQMLDLPWLVFADWNMPPQQLLHSGWVDQVDGCLAVPSNCDYSCTASHEGTMLDYAVYSPSCRPLLRSVTSELAVPWGTHTGLVIEMMTDISELMTRQLCTPLRLPRPETKKITHKKETKAQFISKAKTIFAPTLVEDAQVFQAPPSEDQITWKLKG